ncbi:MAG: recombinase family protein [Treponema sp.]|nr:recombinase family protein [Treponema sp.]
MCKLYSYCRVSTQRQDLQRQIDNITKLYPNAAIYSDKFTGATTDRPNWNKLHKLLQAGDTVVFDSVSRMSRNAAEGSELYQELYCKGVNLIFINEPHCNTDTYKQSAAQSIPETGNEIADIYIQATNKVIMILAKRQIEIAFEQAEKERKDICKRVKEGMQAKKNKAAAEGITITYGLEKGAKLTVKKAAPAKDIILKHSKDFNGTLTDSEVCKLAGISRNTYYKYKAELRAELDK